VHYSKKNNDFIDALDNIDTTQILLKGDIFDFLVNDIKSTISYNKELIEKINFFSKKRSIIYLEGNHDFNLKDIFVNIEVVPISKQPLLCKYKDKYIAISHGDCFEGIFYKIFTFIIRNQFVLYVLNIIDSLFNKKMFDFIIKQQLNKKKCDDKKYFDKKIKNIIHKYPKDIDMIIEGHHHQGKSVFFDKIKYINLSAFICDKKIHKIQELI
jgi:UDP-2,3-diacylglucosamine hydrolase